MRIKEIIENATAGGMGSGSVASVATPVGKTQRRNNKGGIYENDVDPYEHAYDMGTNFLDNNRLAAASIADLRDRSLGIEDKRGLKADLINDISGAVKKELDRNHMLTISDQEIDKIAEQVLFKFMKDLG